MTVQSPPAETLVAVGQVFLSKNGREVLKATRVATSIVVTAYDPTTQKGGMVHMALPESKIARNPGDPASKYVDIALPDFIRDLIDAGIDREALQIKIIGGAQLFNFGGGSGNVLNIGTRNAITARTILSREGLQVEKTETGGNKPRTVTLDMQTGVVQVYHPGEPPRCI